RTADWHDQRALFSSAAAASPASARVWFNLGTCDLNDRDYALAADRFARAVAIAPDWAGAHMSRGIALDQDHRAQEAQRAFRRAALLEPQCRDCALNLVHFDLRHGRLADARADLDRYRAAGGESDLLAQLEADLARLARGPGKEQ